MKYLIVLGVCLLGMAYYGYKHIDWNPPKKKVITVVEVNGKTVPLGQVHAIQIPQEVYDSMADNPEWKGHLLGDKKRVLLITWDGCPYARAFKQALERAFTTKYIDNFYTQDIVVTGQTVWGSCQGPQQEICPKIWIMNHCMGGICIINPKTHEAIVDESQNAQQILPLLAAYAKWDTNPLLGGS